MSRKKREPMELRFYEIPRGEAALVLSGEKWKFNYGNNRTIYHFHNVMEIGMCHLGNGELFLDKKIEHYTEGMFSVIPKNVPHITNSDNGCISYWEYIFIDVEKEIEACFSQKPEMTDEICKLVNRKALLIRAGEQNDIVMLIQRILEESGEQRKFGSETVRELIRALLLGIARMNSENRTAPEHKRQGIGQIAPAVDYIRQNYAQQLKVRQLADYCHLSETHFRRIFQECIQMTPVEYINLVRVQMACDLLQKQNNSMEEVAFRVGFQTASTMNRNFNKILGITPYQWKKQNNHYEAKLNEYHITAKKGW